MKYVPPRNLAELAIIHQDNPGAMRRTLRRNRVRLARSVFSLEIRESASARAASPRTEQLPRSEPAEILFIRGNGSFIVQIDDGKMVRAPSSMPANVESAERYGTETELLMPQGLVSTAPPARKSPYLAVGLSEVYDSG